MQKFTEVNESKKFFADPRIIKRYANFIIPLYITGDLKCEARLIDEWLLMNTSKEKLKNIDMICELEILAVRNVLDASPVTPSGYNQLRLDIGNRCIKLERFLRKYLIALKTDFVTQ